MQTTAENLNKLRITLERHYHPVFWYLPEYLAFLDENPNEVTSTSLLNSLRRFITIQRLPLPPMVDNKQVITRISFERTTTDEVAMVFVCASLAETDDDVHNYKRFIASHSLLQHINLLDVFCSRNRVMSIPTALLCKQNLRGIAGSDEVLLRFEVETFNKTLLNLLSSGVKVVLGKYFLQGWKKMPATGEECESVRNVFFSLPKNDSAQRHRSFDPEAIVQFFK